jgi:hypothetical protein
VYRLIHTSEYDRELEAIEADAGVLAKRLEGVYFILERGPKNKAWLLRGTDIWWRSHAVVPGLLMVRIYYRIDEALQTVTLVSIRSIDLTRM